jgi:hypothetical protein
VDGQRAAALRFADPRVQGLLHVLLLFVLVQGTFAHSDLREHLPPLLGQKPSQLARGRITYDLRRLRLHGLIERIPTSYRYRITANGLRTTFARMPRYIAPMLFLGRAFCRRRQPLTRRWSSIEPRAVALPPCFPPKRRPGPPLRGGFYYGKKQSTDRNAEWERLGGPLSRPWGNARSPSAELAQPHLKL